MLAYDTALVAALLAPSLALLPYLLASQVPAPIPSLGLASACAAAPVLHIYLLRHAWSADLTCGVQGMLASDVQRKPIRSDQFPPSYNDGLRNVVSAMLQANPQARPTASSSLVRVWHVSSNLRVRHPESSPLRRGSWMK